LCTLLTLVGKVDTESAALELGAIQLIDSILRAFLIGELDEAEALGAIGLTIVDDADIVYVAGLREVVTKIIFSCSVWQVSD